jgi:hypothetical protein
MSSLRERVVKKTVMWLILIVNFGLTGSLAAAESNNLENMSEPAAFNAAVGWLTELYLIERRAVIGSVHYDLGPAFEPPKVEWRDVIGGTVEMLSRGMFVAVKYIQQDAGLRVTEIRVIEGSGSQEDY